MTNASALRSALVGLGDAIRTKVGTTSSMTLSDMTSAVGSIGGSYQSNFINIQGTDIPISITNASRDIFVTGSSTSGLYTIYMQSKMSTSFAGGSLVGHAGSYVFYMHMPLLSFPNGLSSHAFAQFKGTTLGGISALRDVSGTVPPYAFFNCANLESLTLLNVTGVPDSSNMAFALCSRLEYLEMPNCTFISYWSPGLGGYSMYPCFSNDLNLRVMKLPKMFYFQGNYMFGRYQGAKPSHLEYVEFNWSLMTEFPYFMAGQEYLCQTISAPNITSIAYGMFDNANRISAFYFDNGRTSSNIVIRSNAFVTCFDASVIDFGSRPITAYGSAFVNLAVSSMTFGSTLYAMSSSVFVRLKTRTMTFCGDISGYVGLFSSCNSLASVYLMSDSVINIPGSASNVFYSTPITNSEMLGEFGSVYVPASLYTGYLASGYWNTISDRLVPIS